MFAGEGKGEGFTTCLVQGYVLLIEAIYRAQVYLPVIRNSSMTRHTNIPTLGSPARPLLKAKDTTSFVD